jgi:hypothetical protein
MIAKFAEIAKKEFTATDAKSAKEEERIGRSRLPDASRGGQKIA